MHACNRMLAGGVKLIVENPYSSTHYLTKYWAIPAKIIDTNRRLKGDFMKKPTQYWFIGMEPKNNLVFEGLHIEPKKTVSNAVKEGEINRTVLRSMISPNYANRFIREYIVDETT